MKATACDRLIQILYHVTIFLVVVMLILVPVQTIVLLPLLCCFYNALFMVDEYRFTFSEIHLTVFKRE